MGMSHAAAIWIPGSGFKAKGIEALVRQSCEYALAFDVSTRKDPAATCIVAPLDEQEDLQMKFDLLGRTAQRLAIDLGTRTYALYAFFGSGDFLMIEAFGPNGKSRRSAGSTDDDIKAPYWKMLKEVAPGFDEDVLSLCIKPAFDLSFAGGWDSAGSFVTDGDGGESVESMQQELAALSAEAFEAVHEQVRVRSFEIVRPVKAKPARKKTKARAQVKKKKPVAKKAKTARRAKKR
jgi:hypothetical protein